MARKKLTIQEQIDILKNVKHNINYNIIFPYGICFEIDKCLYLYGIKISNYKFIKCYIPTFTYKHVCEITKDTDLYPEKTEYNTNGLSNYWWNVNNCKIRKKVINLLIKELQTKIK